MKTFQKLSNGYMLEIIIDDEALFKKLDNEIQSYQELLEKHPDLEKERIEAEENQNDDYYDYRWEYNMQSVYGDPESDYCTPTEIIRDLNEFKKIITNAVNGDGSELWAKVSLKKNGTFKKTSKPTLKEAINGSYWEDSYGWNTMVLRLEPGDDTHVHLDLSHIVLHY